MDTLSVAVSPCPNDVYIFGAWLLGLVPQTPDGPPPASFSFLDVETLNRAALAGKYDLIKVSAATALELEHTFRIISSGAAFGLGAGPKLVARADFTGPPGTIAVPGVRTTALALLRAALLEHDAAKAKCGKKLLPTPEAVVKPMRYDAIVDAVVSKKTDCGLLIHESALVYERYGLQVLLDIGKWWDAKTGGAPLPLGCIIAKNALGADMHESLAERIRSSLKTAEKHPDAVRPLMRSLAREIDRDTLDAHVEAYVNDMSRDMGPEGARALVILHDFLKNDEEWRDQHLPTFEESW